WCASRPQGIGHIAQEADCRKPRPSMSDGCRPAREPACGEVQRHGRASRSDRLESCPSFSPRAIQLFALHTACEAGMPKPTRWDTSITAITFSTLKLRGPK